MTDSNRVSAIGGQRQHFIPVQTPHITGYTAIIKSIISGGRITGSARTTSIVVVDFKLPYIGSHN